MSMRTTRRALIVGLGGAVAAAPAVAVAQTVTVDRKLQSLITAANAASVESEHYHQKVWKPLRSRWPAGSRDEWPAELREANQESDDRAAADANAEYAVACFPCRTATDLHAKLAFMVARNMDDGTEWLHMLLADAARISKLEG